MFSSAVAVVSILSGHDLLLIIKDVPAYATREIVHTPLGILFSVLAGTLHNVVAQNARNLEGLVDLHAGVDSGAAVLVKFLAGLCASGQEDSDVVWGVC